MHLPQPLALAIDEFAYPVEPRALARAAEEMRDLYRGDAPASFRPDTAAHQAAYAVLRMPATYAAARVCVGEVAAALPGFEPASLLDLGAGPGTTAWAVQDVWDGLAAATLVEREAGFRTLGGVLAAAAPDMALGTARWIAADLLRPVEPFPSADLVTISYVLGEMKSAERARVLEHAWQSTAGVLLIVEPGTPRGFATIMTARDTLLARGGHVVAPCSHAGICPLQAAGEWCHFAVRLSRTARHRAAKGGTLGYEDEKFSWLAMARNPAPIHGQRVLEQPRVNKAEITLRLCAEGTAEQHIIRRHDQPDAYRQAKRTDWGDVWG